MKLMIIKTLLVKIGTNLIGMLMTEKMILWGMRFAAKQSKNSVDDNLVDLVEAAYKNDAEKFQTSVSKLTDAIKGK